jgi:hypothetical protein
MLHHIPDMAVHLAPEPHIFSSISMGEPVYHAHDPWVFKPSRCLQKSEGGQEESVHFGY